MTGIITNTKKKGKSLAQDIAKQMAREPLEILKNAGEQVAGTTETAANETASVQTDKPRTNQNEVLEKHLEVQGQRQMAALEQEMKEIRTIKENKTTQEKTARAPIKDQLTGPLIEPTTRPKRGMFRNLGHKLQAKRQEERVEKPLTQG